MKNRLIKLQACLILFSMLFQSCTKEQEVKKALYAGKSDSSCVYKEYSPPLQLILISDPGSSSLTGKDSIDIDMDGTYDIDFIYVSSSTIPSMYCKLQLKNGFVAVAKQMSIPQGMGNIMTITFLDTLPYNDAVKMHSYWSKDAYFWLTAPFYYISGPWRYLNKYYFVGIRRIKTGEEDKFGWICVDAENYEKIKLISYAFEK